MQTKLENWSLKIGVAKLNANEIGKLEFENWSCKAKRKRNCKIGV